MKKTAADLRFSRPPRARLDEDSIAHDPAPDVYTVTWDATRTVVVVEHYPNRLAATPKCCTVTGTMTADDRAQQSAEVPAEVYTLRRLRMPCGVDERET